VFYANASEIDLAILGFSATYILEEFKDNVRIMSITIKTLSWLPYDILCFDIQLDLIIYGIENLIFRYITKYYKNYNYLGGI